MTIKELYHATKLIGPILLTYPYEDIYGQDSIQEKTYSTASDLCYNFRHIGNYKVTRIQALRGTLNIIIEKP